MKMSHIIKIFLLVVINLSLLSFADTKQKKSSNFLIGGGIVLNVCKWESVPLVIGINSCGKKLCHGTVKCEVKLKTIYNPLSTSMPVVCLSENGGCPSATECILQHYENTPHTIGDKILPRSKEDFSILPAQNYFIEEGIVKNKYHGSGKLKTNPPSKNSDFNQDTESTQ